VEQEPYLLAKIMLRLQFPILLYSAAGLFFLGFITLGSPVILELELFSNSRVSFPVSVILDKTRLRFCIVVSLIAARVFLFAHKYIEADPNKNRFL